MSDPMSGWTLTIPGQATLHTETCISCGVVFAFATGLYEELKRKRGVKKFYCPNGHNMWYTGKTDETKLREAEAALQAKDDQLRAAIREGDQARQETLRIRQRISNGVCPCCTRSFGDLRRHMSTQHPDYAVPGDWKHQAGPFRCSCGHKFENFRGLRTHQGHMRDEDWDKPGTSSYWAHLTVV